MLKHLELAGCKFTPASIQCYPCPEDLAAQSGFHPDYGVMLCQNRTHLPTKAYAESALTHELMHAFDYCRFKMDFNNVRHHACSEVSDCSLRLKAYPVVLCLHLGLDSCIKLIWRVSVDQGAAAENLRFHKTPPSLCQEAGGYLDHEQPDL
jgi:hypothetical protein